MKYGWRFWQHVTQGGHKIGPVQWAKDGWYFIEMQNDYSQCRAAVVLRCMKTAWNRGSSKYGSFSFACEPQSLSSLLSHTAQAQDTARLVLIKDIKWYSDSQGGGATHEKRPWLFGFCGGDVWLVEHDSSIPHNGNHTAAFISIKHM